jgi:hypothetical protein
MSEYWDSLPKIREEFSNLHCCRPFRSISTFAAEAKGRHGEHRCREHRTASASCRSCSRGLQVRKVSPSIQNHQWHTVTIPGVACHPRPFRAGRRSLPTRRDSRQAGWDRASERSQVLQNSLRPGFSGAL